MAFYNPSEDPHWYSRDGEPRHDADLRTARKERLLPSVTTYLGVWPKERLNNWKIEQAIKAALAAERLEFETDDQFLARIGRETDREMNAAAVWGSALHAGVERFAASATFPDEPFMNGHWEKLREWWEMEIDSVILSERVLVSARGGFAGTVDLIALTKRWGVCVIDFKGQNVRERGPMWHDKYLHQLTAYAHAAVRQQDTPVEEVHNIVSVVLHRDEPRAPYAKVWTHEEWKWGWQCFVACQNLWCLERKYDPRES